MTREKYDFYITARMLGNVPLFGVKNYKGEDVPNLGAELYPFTSSGQAYDLLAVAIGEKGENEMEEYCNLQEGRDQAVQYVIDNYDYDAAYLKALNAASDDYAVIKKLTGDRVSSPGLQRAEEAGLLFGAWYALNMPDEYKESLREWTYDVKDKARCFYDRDASVPMNLLNACQKAEEETMDEQHKEYLFGSYDSRRNNWYGVYEMASRHYFDAPDCISATDEDRAKNRFRVSIDAEQARALMGEDRTPGLDRVRSYLVTTIVHQAKENDRKETEKIEARRAERKAENARRKAIETEQEEKRKKYLSSMTR